ncbi:MAG: Dabb family protein [Planctomycetota bacterium]
MRKTLLTLAVTALLFAAGCGREQLAECERPAEPMLAHNVFFTLNDDSDAAGQELAASCYRLLEDHPGVVFFAAGPLVEEFDRPVNVRDFHVGLHIVFRSKKFHDRYQVSDKHLQFIRENGDSFKRVRVFDTFVR